MTCLSSSGSAGVHSAVARSMVEHLREKVQFFEEQMRDSFETKIQNYEQNQIKNDPKLLEKLQHQKSEILERIHLIESAIRKLEQAQIELKKLKENLALAQTNFSGQVAHLNQENKKLAQSIENIMFQFLSNVEIVQKIGLEHDSLLAEIQSGNHPVLKEIETLLFDLEKFAHEKVKELNFEILSFNQEANAFNEESASDSYHIQDLEVRISRYYEDYQNAANSVNRARQDRYEKGIQRYEFIHDNYSPAEKFLEEDDDEKVESIVNVIKKELNAEQFAEELKNSFDLKKQEFEIEYQKYLESKKRIDSCIQEKLIYFDQKRSELESYQKRVEEQLNEQKVLVDQQINLLDQTLESQLSSLSNQHQEMHLDLV
jgi:hypothetical protein